MGSESELSLDGLPPFCRGCRSNGRPRARFLTLTRRHRRAMDEMLAAPTLAEGERRAMEATGFSRRHLRDLRDGRRVPEYRRLFQLKLEARGADLDTVAGTMANALTQATEPKWDPAAGVFREFVDHRTRLRAAEVVAKHLEVGPPQGGERAPTVAIQINHNLGAGETIDPPGVFRAPVRTAREPGSDEDGE